MSHTVRVEGSLAHLNPDLSGPVRLVVHNGGPGAPEVDVCVSGDLLKAVVMEHLAYGVGVEGLADLLTGVRGEGDILDLVLALHAKLSPEAQAVFRQEAPPSQ